MGKRKSYSDQLNRQRHEVNKLFNEAVRADRAYEVSLIHVGKAWMAGKKSLIRKKKKQMEKLENVRKAAIRNNEKAFRSAPRPTG